MIGGRTNKKALIASLSSSVPYHRVTCVNSLQRSNLLQIRERGGQHHHSSSLGSGGRRGSFEAYPHQNINSTRSNIRGFKTLISRRPSSHNRAPSSLLTIMPYTIRDPAMFSKIQGFQLFVGSIVAFFFGCNRYQFLRAYSTSSTGGEIGEGVDPSEREKLRKKSKIYTKTGDRGTSSLFSGERRGKDDPTFGALGATDELNAVLGVAKEYATKKNGLEGPLTIIQSRLMDMGAAIATPAQTSSDAKKERVKFDAIHVELVEKWIDDLDGRLPPLKNFILPSGGLCSAHLHVARTVCRRAERAVIPLTASEQVDPEVGIYLNRLSDFLFVAARWAAKSEGQQETIWTK